MKANEFRIGNYYNQFGNIEKVSWVTLKNLEEDLNEKLWCKPIPLTDEMLINLGAFKFDNQFIFDRFRIKYRPDYKFYYVLCKETNAYITKVEFVHEWQNVVFDLNGEELTFKSE